MAKGCFDVHKNDLQRDNRSFAAVLSEMDLGNVDTRKAYVFVRRTSKYVVKSTKIENISPRARCIVKLTSLDSLEILRY